jgi:hypothetical protein
VGFWSKGTAALGTMLSGQINGTGDGTAVTTKGGGNVAVPGPIGRPGLNTIVSCPACAYRPHGGPERFIADYCVGDGSTFAYRDCRDTTQHFHRQCFMCRYKWVEGPRSEAQRHSHSAPAVSASGAYFNSSGVYSRPDAEYLSRFFSAQVELELNQRARDRAAQELARYRQALLQRQRHP